MEFPSEIEKEVTTYKLKGKAKTFTSVKALWKRNLSIGGRFYFTSYSTNLAISVNFSESSMMQALFTITLKEEYTRLQISF